MNRTKRSLRVACLFVLSISLAATLLADGWMILSVPQITQQHSYWCWAATSQTILSYYGTNVAQCEIANYGQQRGDCCQMSTEFDTRHDCNATNSLNGTYGTAGILQHWGLSTPTYSGAALSWAEVLSEIDAGRPFVIRWGWDGGGGHELTGYGYSYVDGSYTRVSYMNPSPDEGYTSADYAWTVHGSDHTWTHTLLMTNPPTINLRPHTPPGWSAPIVVSTTTGTNTDSGPLRSSDIFYFDWAAINDSNTALRDTPVSGMHVHVYLDGATRIQWGPDPLAAHGIYSGVDNGVSFLTAGTHTFRLVVDPDKTVPEGNENDNEYTKTITILPALSFDFDGNHYPDIVWRNRVTWEISIWLMNGLTQAGDVRLTGPTDRNWKIAALADVNLDGSPDFIWRNAATGANRIWLMAGTTYASAIDLPGVPDAAWHIVGARDFNGDEKPDIVWRNQSTGQNVIWFMDGVSYAGFANLPPVADTKWTIEGVDDFNGDGQPDLLWHHAEAGTLVWFMNGVAMASYAWLPQRSSEWIVAWTGEFDRNHKADVIWRNVVTGANEVTYMDGATVVATNALPALAHPDWDVMHSSDVASPGQTDFNIDGYPDILWRNTATGDNRIWYLNNATKVGEAGVFYMPAPTDWRSVAVADFDLDGSTDIVWHRASTGDGEIWMMVGAARRDASVQCAGASSGCISLPRVPVQWRIVGAGDFNRDGHPDLIWRNLSTGANIIWFMRNGVYYDWTAPPTITDTNWRIVAVGDFNGDGWPDLFWRNQSTGVNIAWFLVRGVYTGWAAPPTIGDVAWQIVGSADYNRDGKADLLWRHATSGQNLIWYLSNGAYVGWAALPSMPLEWRTGPWQ